MSVRKFIVCSLSQHKNVKKPLSKEEKVQNSYVFGFLIVPLRLLILVIISKSLKRKNPRSFRPPWPCGIDTRSNNRNCLSLVTKSDIPSMTPYTKKKIQQKRVFNLQTPLKIISNLNSGFILQVHEVQPRVDHFRVLPSPCNSDAWVFHEPVSKPLGVDFDQDGRHRCALSVLRILIHSCEENIRFRIFVRTRNWLKMMC